jgi:hypothetical protein
VHYMANKYRHDTEGQVGRVSKFYNLDSNRIKTSDFERFRKAIARRGIKSVDPKSKSPQNAREGSPDDLRRLGIQVVPGSRSEQTSPNQQQ